MPPIATAPLKAPPGKTTPASVTATFTLFNRLGLHARAAALLLKTLRPFECEVTVERGHYRVNCKSICGLMSLAAGYGSRLTFTAKGPDAPQAMEALQELFDTQFGPACEPSTSNPANPSDIQLSTTTTST